MWCEVDKATSRLLKMSALNEVHQCSKRQTRTCSLQKRPGGSFGCRLHRIVSSTTGGGAVINFPNKSNNVVQIRLSRREQETDQIASISSETTVWGRLRWDFGAGNHVTGVCVRLFGSVCVCAGLESNYKYSCHCNWEAFSCIFLEKNLKEIILLSRQEIFDDVLYSSIFGKAGIRGRCIVLLLPVSPSRFALKKLFSLGGWSVKKIMFEDQTSLLCKQVWKEGIRFKQLTLPLPGSDTGSACLQSEWCGTHGVVYVWPVSNVQGCSSWPIRKVWAQETFSKDVYC